MTIVSSQNYLIALENLSSIALALTTGTDNDARKATVTDLHIKIGTLYNNEIQWGDPEEADRIEGIYHQASNLIAAFDL